MSEPVTLTLGRERIFDPPPELERLLRSGRSLHRLRFRGGQLGWLVTGYGAARAALKDPRLVLGETRPFHTVLPDKQAAVMGRLRELGLLKAEMLSMDSPEHTRLRALLIGRFSRDGVSPLTRKIEHIVSKRLDLMAKTGPPVDLVESFAAPIAGFTHCALLGVPEADAAVFKRVGKLHNDPAASAEQVIEGTEEFRRYLEAVIERKHDEPDDDLLTYLVASGEFDDEEIVSLSFMLFLAGVDTTESMIATGAFALLCHQDQLDAIREEPALIDGAVEELMRYLTIFNIGTITRTATEDIRLNDEVIHAGESVSVSLLAANRDSSRFEEPDQLDVHRVARGQLGFGHGVHVCLGQHLARLEMRTAFRLLLHRFPTLRLAVPVDELPLSGDQDLVFGVGELPVAWE
jgi:cytochrome P450